MAAPFISLGLKGADALIDKHFHKIPDKYVHADTYSPKNLPKNIPNPLKKKKNSRNDDRSPSPDRDDRARSPSPGYEYEEVDDEKCQDTPRQYGAPPGQFVNPNTGLPPKYSSLPPHVRTEYIPPPPMGDYAPPPTQQPNGQFPPQPTYNQFPPPPPNPQYLPPSPPRTSDPSQVDSRASREHRHSRRSGGRDWSPEADRRSRAARHVRRSSSYDNKHASRYEDKDDDSTVDSYRSLRRPKHTRRSSSYQPQRNQELTRYTAADDDYSSASKVRRAETAPKTQELNPYDEDYDIYQSRRHRPRMETRRSSSFQGRDYYYPPSSARESRRPRRDSFESRRPQRDSFESGSRRYDDIEVRRKSVVESKDNGQFFTKSKEGLLSGALGAVVGGWAADRLQRNGSGRDRDSRRRSGSGRGGPEDDKLLTLLGAAVGGLAVNAFVEKREEGKAKKERVERVRKDGRVYEWDDGYA
jgi:hypothetical protein